MKRILIDLTDLEMWNGNHGGTQRLTYGIAKHFYLNNKSIHQEVIFISFSSRQKIFYKTDFTLIYDRVENEVQLPNVPYRISSKERFKQTVLPYLPDSFRRNPKFRQVAKKSFNASSQMFHSAKTFTKKINFNNNQIKANRPITFQPDDTILILGKPWDDINIQKTLIREKDKTKFKLIQVVYDLIIPLHPQLHHSSLFKDYTQNMFEAVAASDLLLAISQSTLRDLKIFCTNLHLTLPKTKVIRLGDDINIVKSNSNKPDNRIENKFIACIGTIELRKNHMELYLAYKLAQQQNIELPQLILAGSRGWLTSDLQYLLNTDPAIKNKIIILDNLSDIDLEWVYENCLYTVYPSMYEGWGLPVAESLARGKVCIASNSSSIPEIAGDLIEYFSPYNPQECLNTIVKYLVTKLLATKENEIKAKYKTITWGDTYSEVYKTIKNLT